MTVPSYRVPVRVARGTIAALTAGLSDLEQGELCFATDERVLYFVDVGTLVPTVTQVDLISDLTPQLGGNLDTNGYEIVTVSDLNLKLAPDGTGVVEVKGNTGNDAAIQLNCELNTHGVKIKSPPHSAGATYTLVLPETTGTAGEALTTDGSGVLSWATSSSVTSINDLSDVDTATNPPTIDQVLAWDGNDWVPADQTGGGAGGVTSIIAGDGISVDQATGNVTITATGGGGSGGGSTSARLLEAKSTPGGLATFTGIGHSGTLVQVTSTSDAWITLYDTAANRTADSSRAYDTDPALSSGVLAEFYITAGSTVLASPGTTYFNGDTVSAEAIYVAVRDQSGAAENATVTIEAYGDQVITAVSGGTFGSGL